jgi:copper homeostasis protein
MSRLLEVCVDDARGLEAAIAGGADRIELCSALSVGGLTPSPGLMALATGSPVPVYAMVRPRTGGFVYEDADLAQMEADIRAAERAGLAGVVIGASLPDGRLDEPALRRLLSVSRMPATLHRAIDLVPDPEAAVETAIALGFERILTSGGETTALQGIEVIRRMMTQARGRIAIMPGSGITTENVGVIIDQLGSTEIHASCSSADTVGSDKEIALGFAVASPRRTDVEKVRALKAVTG